MTKLSDGQIYAGSIRNFDEYLPHLLKWADFLVQSDEVAEALHILEKSIPGFYRDHVPKEVLDLRRLIKSYLMTTADYMVNDGDDPCPVEHGQKLVNLLTRGKTVKEIIVEYNKAGITPHVVDMGPGDYWLAQGLKADNCKFTYQPVSLQITAHSTVRERLGEVYLPKETGAPNIFVACEIIEHLWNPHEIEQTAAKLNTEPKDIVISTPYYTFGGGCTTWRNPEHKGKVGHIRTFTPNEFYSAVNSMFPGYDWTMLNDGVMVLRGKLLNESAAILR